MVRHMPTTNFFTELISKVKKHVYIATRRIGLEYTTILATFKDGETEEIKVRREVWQILHKQTEEAGFEELFTLARCINLYSKKYKELTGRVEPFEWGYIADGPIQAGQPVTESHETGHVIAIDPARQSDNLVMGVCRHVEGDLAVVEMNVQSPYFSSPAMMTADDLERLENAIDRLNATRHDIGGSFHREYMGEFLSPSVRPATETRPSNRRSFTVPIPIAQFADIEDSKPRRRRKKYYTSEIGLKRTPVKLAAGYRWLGEDHVSKDTYGGCNHCYWYSLVFFNKCDPEGTLIIENDEDFEKVKQNFVDHFNKAHPDIVAKKMNIKDPEKMT